MEPMCKAFAVQVLKLNMNVQFRASSQIVLNLVMSMSTARIVHGSTGLGRLDSRSSTLLQLHTCVVK